MNKKILLLQTPVEDQNRTQDVIDESGSHEYPIGLLYLDSILEKEGYEVYTKSYMSWRDNNFFSEIERLIKVLQPDFIGFSVWSMTRVSSYKTINLVKKINPDIKIILGGIHASIMYRQLLENFPIDAICIGESEESLVELLEAIIKKKSLNKVKGIAFKKNNKVIYTGPRKIVLDIDKYPFPNLDKFMNKNIKTVKIITSRGCPNRCSFCCLDVISKRIWRQRKINAVVDEIELVLKKYPWVDIIEFNDDTSTLDNQRIIGLCKEIIKRGIKKRIYCQARIKPVSKEMFYWMEKAGVVEIRFGIETGSEKLLKSIHKEITKEDCINTFKLLKDFKIKPVKFLITGLPGENEETIRETIEFTKALQNIIKMDFFTATPLWVYPGTEVYEIAKKKGMIDDDFWLTNKPCPLYTAEHSEEWLRKMSNKIAIESIIAQGKIYFLKKLLQKVTSNPKYYLKRITQGF